MFFEFMDCTFQLFKYKCENAEINNMIFIFKVLKYFILNLNKLKIYFLIFDYVINEKLLTIILYELINL